MGEIVRSMLMALCALLAVMAAHFLVGPWSQMFDDPAKSYRWLQYLLRGPEVIVFALIAVLTTRWWPEPGRSLLLVAAVLAMIEEAKISFCGAVLFDTEPSALHLCTRAFGPWPNLIGAATALTFWIVVAKRREKEDPIP